MDSHEGSREYNLRCIERRFFFHVPLCEHWSKNWCYILTFQRHVEKLEMLVQVATTLWVEEGLHTFGIDEECDLDECERVCSFINGVGENDECGRAGINRVGECV